MFFYFLSSSKVILPQSNEILFLVHLLSPQALCTAAQKNFSCLVLKSQNALTCIHSLLPSKISRFAGKHEGFPKILICDEIMVVFIWKSIILSNFSTMTLKKLDFSKEAVTQ